jgi:hypothetical protein
MGQWTRVTASWPRRKGAAENDGLYPAIGSHPASRRSRNFEEQPYAVGWKRRLLGMRNVIRERPRRGELEKLENNPMQSAACIHYGQPYPTAGGGGSENFAEQPHAKVTQG